MGVIRAEVAIHGEFTCNYSPMRSTSMTVVSRRLWAMQSSFGPLRAAHRGYDKYAGVLKRGE